MCFRVHNFKIVLVLCVGLMGGCSDSDNNSVQTTPAQFSYSVLMSATGSGANLLEELNSAVLPVLKSEGAQEYAIWSRSSDPSNDFEEIAEDKLVLMLRWESVKTERLSEVLEAMTDVSEVTTSLWEASLRGGESPVETAPGFYLHRFNRYLNEDVDEVLSLSEQAWVTWEPFWGAKTVGVWRELNELDESNGVTRLLRIAWYRDMDHWQETREFGREPESFQLFIERAALQLDDESWSADLQPD